MDVLIESDPGAVAGRAADLVEDLVRTRPAAVLGLAAGSTPRPTYRELIRRHAEGGLSFGGVEAFLLDEYVGLPPGHPQALRAAVARGFSDHVDLDPDRLHSLDGTADDLDAAAAAFEAELARAGPVDLQILGIGRNRPGIRL